MPIKSGVYQVDTNYFHIFKRVKKSDCHGVKSQKIKSQKLHVPILETIRKNLHPQKKPVIRYVIGYPGVLESVKISSLNSSVDWALAWYARGPGFESRLRLDFSQPVTSNKKIVLYWQLGHIVKSSRLHGCLSLIYI